MKYVLQCRYDYVKFSNENNYIFGKYCGEKTGQTVEVTGNNALITFLSDSVYEKRGFSLVFSKVALGTYN